MVNFQKWLDYFGKRFFSSTYQIERILMLVVVVFGLAAVSFGAYYYYDRYYVSQAAAPSPKQNLAVAEQAVRDDPQNLDKRFMLAQAYMLSSRWNDAITQALQVKQSKPEELRADFVLGICYANNGQPKDAIEPLQKYVDSLKGEDMLGLNKQYLSALYYLGESYMQLGEPEKAIPPLEETAVLGRTDADALYKLGMAYSAVKRYDEALVVLNRAVAFVPDYLEAYQAMIVVFEAQDKKPEANYARGMVAYSQKDYSSAHTLLLQTAQDNPGFEPALLGLGRTCEAQNDLQCALDAYTAATLLDQADINASQGLERVQTLMKK